MNQNNHRLTLFRQLALPLAFAIFAGCANAESHNEKKQRDFNTFFMSGVCWATLQPYSKYLDARDNHDGTLSVVIEDGKSQTMPLCFFAPSTSSTRTFTMKKCAQGQLYRPLPDDDCKGTGTAADYYGIQTFQWCPTNDYSCENLVNGSYVPDPAKSPVHASCENDTFLGKKWKVASYSKSYLSSNIDTTGTVSEIGMLLATRPDEVPIGSSNYYWEYYGAGLLRSAAASFDGTTGIYYRTSSNKADYHYLFCYTTE